jgi:hypothetical protein
MEMRKFSEQSPVTYCFSNTKNPLIKISKKGETDYFCTESEKKNAIRERKKGDKFLLSWVGQWKTDVFELEEKDFEIVMENHQ